jgi:hypothetical protein
MTTLALALILAGEMLRGMNQQAELQTAADLTAISAARIQARALNGIAHLNHLLEEAEKLSQFVIATASAVSVCAAACAVGVGCACLRILPRVINWSKKTLKRIEKFSTKIAALQDRIIQLTPIGVASAVQILARKNGANSAIHSVATDKLEGLVSFKPILHVQRGKNKKLAADQDNPLNESECQNITCKGLVDEFFGLFIDLPGLIYLSTDFHQKQRIAVALSKDVSYRSPQSRKPWKNISFKSTAQARPFSTEVNNSESTTAQPLLSTGWDIKLENLTIKLPTSFANAITNLPIQ